jgi:hypothetical protein
MLGFVLLLHESFVQAAVTSICFGAVIWVGVISAATAHVFNDYGKACDHGIWASAYEFQFKTVVAQWCLFGVNTLLAVAGCWWNDRKISQRKERTQRMLYEGSDL